MIGDWTERGACRVLADELGITEALKVFFPDPGKLTRHHDYCDDCEVRCECLLWGVLVEDHGAWGGTTHRERTAMRQDLSEGVISLVELLHQQQCDGTTVGLDDEEIPDFVASRGTGRHTSP